MCISQAHFSFLFHCWGLFSGKEVTQGIVIESESHWKIEKKVRGRNETRIIIAESKSLSEKGRMMIILCFSFVGIRTNHLRFALASQPNHSCFLCDQPWLTTKLLVILLKKVAYQNILCMPNCPPRQNLARNGRFLLITLKEIFTAFIIYLLNWGNVLSVKKKESQPWWMRKSWFSCVRPRA